MMPTWTYFVKWLIPVIVFILSFLPLNLVTITSDPKDIYTQPRCDNEMHKNSFVPRCLFKYM